MTTRTRMETAHLLCNSDDFEDVISTLKKEGAELERELDEARAELAELKKEIK
jgi:prefoldin subunit 5